MIKDIVVKKELVEKDRVNINEKEENVRKILTCDIRNNLFLRHMYTIGVYVWFVLNKKNEKNRLDFLYIITFQNYNLQYELSNHSFP